MRRATVAERAADWDAAIDTLSQMKSESISPDAISYTSAVGALGRARGASTGLQPHHAKPP